MKVKLQKIAPSYSEQQVLLTTIDVTENTDMTEFLIDNKTPTIHVFRNGKTGNNSFVGDRDEEFIRRYINNIIENSDK